MGPGLGHALYVVAGQLHPGQSGKPEAVQEVNRWLAAKGSVVRVCALLRAGGGVAVRRDVRVYECMEVPRRCAVLCCAPRAAAAQHTA